MLSYTWYKEYLSKFCKLVLTSALGDMNDLTVFKQNRNSLNHVEMLKLLVFSLSFLRKLEARLEDNALFNAANRV
jgi:hypothetical protein